MNLASLFDKQRLSNEFAFPVIGEKSQWKSQILYNYASKFQNVKVIIIIIWLQIGGIAKKCVIAIFII